jgi:hypothetical protein
MLESLRNAGYFRTMSHRDRADASAALRLRNPASKCQKSFGYFCSTSIGRTVSLDVVAPTLLTRATAEGRSRMAALRNSVPIARSH